jgi:hypothetical protein
MLCLEHIWMGGSDADEVNAPRPFSRPLRAIGATQGNQYGLCLADLLEKLTCRISISLLLRVGSCGFTYICDIQRDAGGSRQSPAKRNEWMACICSERR